MEGLSTKPIQLPLKTDPIKEHEASCAKCIAGIYYCAARMKLVKAHGGAQGKKGAAKAVADTGRARR
jgi:hypothetical protein